MSEFQVKDDLERFIIEKKRSLVLFPDYIQRLALFGSYGLASLADEDLLSVFYDPAQVFCWTKFYGKVLAAQVKGFLALDVSDPGTFNDAVGEFEIPDQTIVFDGIQAVF